MSDIRSEMVEKIIAERARQFDLPGAEWDRDNTPNDWLAIAGSYCSRGAARKHCAPYADDFEDDLVKAAAVILAALEHIETMRKAGTLS